MTFKLYFGDIYPDLAEQAKSDDPTAFLIDHSNYKDFLNRDSIDNITAYTSLGDLPDDLPTVYQLLDRADKIYYCAPEKWSDGQVVDYDFPDQSIQGLTDIILSYFQNQKQNVYNFSLDNYSNTKYLSLAHERGTDNPVIWSVGPSIAGGLGVDNNESYAALVGKYFNMPVRYIADSGSSITWAADQILRSDIRTGDIIIWLISDYCRFSFWDSCSQKAQHVLPSWREDSNIKLDLPGRVIDTMLLDDTRFYEAITHIHQIISYCERISAKLLLVDFGCVSTNRLYLHLHNIPQFKMFKNKNFSQQYIDLGNDNRHPGPQQHQHYADFCINYIKNSNYLYL